MAKGKAAAMKLLNAIVNTVKQIPSKLLSIGKNIVQGLWNGISGATGWLMGKIKSCAKGIVDGIKGALGINSPSVVMEKLFKWVPVGAGQGIINNAKYAVNAVKNMGGKISTAASKISPTIGAVSAKLPKFGTGGTVTRPQTAVVGDTTFLATTRGHWRLCSHILILILLASMHTMLNSISLIHISSWVNMSRPVTAMKRS